MNPAKHYFGRFTLTRGRPIDLRQWGHRRSGRRMRLTIAFRTAGKLGRGGDPSILCSPPRCGEATMLQEGVGDHRHQGVPVKALPGPPLEVIKAEFLFQLLMRLLANPTRVDDGGQSAQDRLGRQAGEVGLLFSRGALLADQMPSAMKWCNRS